MRKSDLRKTDTISLARDADLYWQAREIIVQQIDVSYSEWLRDLVIRYAQGENLLQTEVPDREEEIDLTDLLDEEW